MENNGYIIGLDVGIGSIGWAVVNSERERIEDFGVRLFDSGEDARDKERKSQQRRGFRAARRLVRRRAHRLQRLKAYLEAIGLIASESLEAYYAQPHIPHPLELRVKGLSEKLAPTELAAALLHIAKHRGHIEFYDLSDEEKKALSEKEKKDLEQSEKYTEKYRVLMETMPQGTTPAQLFLMHPQFMSPDGVRYRNSQKQDADKHVLVPRAALRDEAERICAQQAKFYPCLTEDARNKIFEIMFQQRAFEDGPGDPLDPDRKYKGFLDTVGKCRIYPEEDRGARYSVLGDLFVLVNRLSQNRFYSSLTGELVDSSEANRAMLETALLQGDLTQADIKAILKPFGIEMLNTNENAASPNQCIAFVRLMKPILMAAGMDWETVIRNEYPFAPYRKDSLLNAIGKILSENRTPERRVKLLNAQGIPAPVTQKLRNKKLSGTVNVSNRYMLEAVDAFLDGEIFGNFNARREKELHAQKAAQKRHMKLPPIQDGEYTNNPVVFRSINETRKVLNAIIEKHGSPAAINVEVAADLSRSFAERDKISAENRKNQKQREKDAERIAELLKVELEDVGEAQRERYRLGELQKWKCPYCMEPIRMEYAIRPSDRSYEIDHIIPFSLILDNTIHNKVLVHSGCNQAKGQRTPLMYLAGNEQRRKEFVQWVNASYNNKKEKLISQRKRDYLMQPDLNRALMDEWKSRNLNDTRYIAKYLVRYLDENLLFNAEKQSGNVYAVKGAITARLRRVWLNKDTWGVDDKDELRKTTNLHHAVDAVVIANCLPAYVELAEEALRLQRIYRDEGKRKTEKWMNALNDAVERLFQYRHLPKAYSERMLQNIKRIPSLLPDLRNEIDTRFCGCALENEAEYRKKLRAFYADDPAFADDIRMPLVSYKPDRKFSGKITKENALKKEKAKGSLIKHIGEGNETVLDDSSYYCFEIYRTVKGALSDFPIKYSMLSKQGGKLALKVELPKDYSNHVTYVYPGDYIKVFDKSGVKFEGYYKSTKNAVRHQVNISDRISPVVIQSQSFARMTDIKKFDVSILGDMHEITAKDCEGFICGKPFLSEPNQP